MPITLDPLPISPAISAMRPLAGMTVLVVEDSRFASDAVRLLCLKSGARIRRADSLKAARRHLIAYMPTIIIVDIGLPDGTGMDLIHDLDQAVHRIPVILATSGDDSRFAEAIEMGADGTLLKPIKSLAAFQNIVVDSLPDGMRPDGLRLVTTELVDPDPIAFQDDLAHIAEVIGTANDEQTVDYVAQFLTGLARTAEDNALEVAAISLAAHREKRDRLKTELARVSNLLNERLQRRRAI